MRSKASWLFHLSSLAVLACLAPTSARADFFDDARRTVQNDIPHFFQSDVPHFFQTDVPHFFQDDIPCAFGGQPTSHTKTSCKGPAKPAAGKAPESTPAPAVDNDEQSK
jgi:hypothetical protein